MLLAIDEFGDGDAQRDGVVELLVGGDQPFIERGRGQFADDLVDCIGRKRIGPPLVFERSPPQLLDQHIAQDDALIAIARDEASLGREIIPA